MHGLASDGGNAADSSRDEKAEEHWSGSTSSSRGSAPTVGIALRDGVCELDATAALEVYTQSAAARTVAFVTEDNIRTSHGLVLLTTSTRKAPSLSRIVVPGAADIDPRPQHWADRRHPDVGPRVADRGHGDDRRSGGGFAAALQNLTDHTGAVTEPSTAKTIGCPTTGVDLQRGHTQVRMGLLAVASLALAGLVGLASATMTRRRRRLAVGSITTA